MSERSEEKERHKFHPAAIKEVAKEDIADDDLDYIKNMELDFADRAVDILDNINLSHLRIKRQIKPQSK